MLVDGTSVVGGCYARTQANGSAGVGAAAGAIRHLIEQAGVGAALVEASMAHSPSADAAAATLNYLRGVAASSTGDARASSGHFQSFLQLRPRSAIGYRESAGQAWAMGDLNRAQELYAKALEIQPSLVSARVLYGQLLHERVMPGRALEHLRYAWEHGGRNRTAALIPMCNLLREQGKEQNCADLLAGAVKQNPTDGYLWNYLGQSRAALSDHAGAAGAFERAGELLPENESVRLKAGDEFAASGNRAKAEEQYRAAIAQHPESASAYYALARFLAQDTARREEALAASRIALGFADRPGAPARATIQSLISAIHSGRASAAADFKL
jgi:tetratricopeptide (TPR) repeat protein